MQFHDLAVVGGGMSAMAAVKTFRAVDNVSSVLMISDQPDLPVRKPPLSKQLWAGDLAVADIFYNPARFKVTYQPNTSLASANFARRLLTLSSGDKVRYNQLLIATGLMPKRLPGAFPCVIYFNNLADYRRLRSMVKPQSRVVVVGGGLLAVELASAMLQKAAAVTLVFPGAWPLDRYLPAGLGNILVECLQKAGVVCASGRRAVEVSGPGEIRLDDGTSIAGDLVLPVIGQAPSVGFLGEQGTEASDGVEVDAQLRVKGLEDVFACGDIIKVDGYAERFPHEDNALRSGAHVGQVLAGSNIPYKPTSFLYSEFLGMRLESVGYGKALDYGIAAERWDSAAGRGFAVMETNGCVSRVSLINYQLDPARIERLMKEVIGVDCSTDSSAALNMLSRLLS